jgi:hypothetical protein
VKRRGVVATSAMGTGKGAADEFRAVRVGMA